ncbi:hypothetical protein IGB42_03632 [Andreprevotia sp. IGB-42]|uniref:LEA type 2 family protein n=1 Tax=Andreprevotia sp. IGB-42 TaxID=2497473 RepID=UPI0013586C25|nr:LEA type 2 family protein [Andreprevotia sp. IGB-42]KAF0811822.1 hypothetical protein IGB42_03632 [Andreprevotia sp. IGB-42]
MMKRYLLLMACLWLAACAGIPEHFEKPRLSIADVRLKQAGLLEQRFVLTLRVQNPNKVDIPIDGLDTTLAIAGKPLAQGVSHERVTLPALGEALVPVEVTANLSGLLKAWRAVQGEGKYTLAGRLFVPMRADGVPFAYEGDLPALKGLFNQLVPGSENF